MDPRKTREPVTGHPDADLNAALDSITLSPRQSDAPPDTGYESDISMASRVTAVPPPTAKPSTSTGTITITTTGNTPTWDHRKMACGIP